MYDIVEIKKRLNLIELAQRLGLNVRKAGDRCVSPLRPGATNPTSFRIDEDHWYDFGSGKWGDAIDLVAEINHGGDKGAAIRELAHQLGIETTNTDGWMEYTNNLNNRTAYYHTKLTDADRDYLHGRGLTDADIERLMIGRVTDTALQGRLFLPYHHPNGYVCYYATRAMPGGSFPDNKYMKQRIDDYCQHIPWGMQTLNRGGDTLVIAEGFFDAASFEAQGYPVLSAITGNFSSAQLPAVLDAARMFQRVFFVYDNDKISHAGDKFAEKMARILMKERIPFVVGHVPDEYKDVSEYYAAGELLQTLVNRAEDGLTYLCEMCETIDELSRFLRPIALYDSSAKAEAVIGDLRRRGVKFSVDEWKQLNKRVLAAPSEKEVRDRVTQRHELLYVDGSGFYEWNSLVWERIADSTPKRYCEEVLGNYVTDARAKASCNLVKTFVSNSEVEFNRNPVLTFPNGTLELETGLFREPRKEDYCTIVMDYDYDPAAKCPQWEKFITDITDESGEREENLQFIPGYALMPHCRHEKIFVLLGKGGNGKSVYITILKHLFGEKNYSLVEPAQLPHDFQRIWTKDSLLNFGTDISTNFERDGSREWLLKISSGESISACYKGKDYVTFTPRCKLVFAANSVPTADVINGLDRRLWFIDFRCKFVEDPDPTDPRQKKIDTDLQDKLLVELPGIFNWVYKGYRMLREKGWFVETPEQVDIMNQFRTTSNPIIEFCDDRTFAGTMAKSEVYQWYRDWCESTGHKPLATTRFFPRFREVMDRRIVNETQIRIDGVGKRVFIFKEE